MRHKAGLSLLAVMALVASVAAWGAHRNSHLGRMFASVHAGDSEKQVQQLLGRPSRIEACGKSFGPPRANCTEYIYRDSFAPILPLYWSVKFGSGGHVVDTYVYQSP